jgi:hypothetical protein
MGAQPDATPAQLDHGEVWRKSDLKRAQEQVKRLQERIVQATVVPQFTVGWVVGHIHGLSPCLSRMR